MSWPFSAYIIDHVSAGPIYQNTRGAEMLITALRCPVLKPMRWGKGLWRYHNSLWFQNRGGLALAFNAIFYK